MPSARRPSRFVALLRGVNVGRAKRVAMADLRELVGRLGYAGVRTVLNSGNVVFDAESGAGAAARIAAALVDTTGISAAVTVVSAAELAAAIAGNPFGTRAADPSRLLVVFLNDAADIAGVAALAAQDWAPEGLVLAAGIVYVWCPDASRANAALNRVLGDAATARNWSTVCKLHALAGGAAAAPPARSSRGKTGIL
jgi:uncharacterized protein (DUF1697 family)